MPDQPDHSEERQEERVAILEAIGALGQNDVCVLLLRTPPEGREEDGDWNWLSYGPLSLTEAHGMFDSARQRVEKIVADTVAKMRGKLNAHKRYTDACESARLELVRAMSEDVVDA